MHRTVAIAVVLAVPLAACGQEAKRQAEESRARAVVAETALKEAQEAADEEKLDLEVASVRLLGIAGAIRDEMLAAARPGYSDEDLQKSAERILWFVDDEAEPSSLPGRRLLIEARQQAALLLVRANAGYEQRARELSGSAIALAEAALNAAPEDRGNKALLGDAYVGAARLDRERGALDSAIGSYERGLELLEQADKGRGDGTGSSENRGESSGGGKGRGRGKGRNKAQSLVLKHHTCDVFGELADTYRAAGKYDLEIGTINRERHIQGNICQVESTSKTGGYEVARLGMAELIDRLGDATLRLGDAADAVKVEQLSLTIMRELAEEKPGEKVFTERLVPQGVEIANRFAALGSVEELRATVVQAFEDLKVLQNLGTPPAIMRSDEARLSLAMARGLLQSAAGGTDGAAAQAEAANWYGRAIESLDSLRVDGALPPEYAELEEAALTGIEQLETGG